MSGINILDNGQCPFNSNQYILNIDEIIAPVGSFPWAIIQLYMDKLVRRSKWEPHIYVRPIYDYDGPGNVISFQLVKPDGNVLFWTPDHEDMGAHDWEFEYRLSFTLTVGHNNGQWGSWGSIGKFTNVQSSFHIERIDSLSIKPEDSKNTTIWLNMFINVIDYHKIQNALAYKNLGAIVNNKVYSLSAKQTTIICNVGSFIYEGLDTQKFGDLIIQNDGKTLDIIFSWN
ncbi:MAG: DUF2829 domain-containing protein [Enterobacteriaceae bacterium]|jgi:hypothetical protein|nr:DUF2829 domain-containing protein [Enterobacteriaceae bacterium]